MLPSLFILAALSWAYLALGDLPAVAGILYGIKPVVTAIVAHAAWRIGSRTLRNPSLMAIALLAFLAIFLLNLPFPLIVIGAALLGILGSHFAPEQFQLDASHNSTQSSYGSALIDDDTPAPEHACFSRMKLLRIVLAGLVAWLMVMAVLVGLYGVDATLTQMALFFSKAAMVTFGGAYAVLPYVYQGGVEQYGWLTGGQMIDGLALGETTPGPLIMVVAFVGFVGGWTKELFGPDNLLLAGMAGASVVTFFTFLPSFLFILAGGPLVEATRDEIRFTAPLAAITAAVVGVILNLALFFAWHVLWPDGFAGSFDIYSALIGILVVAAFFKWNIAVIPALAFGMIAGLLHTFFLSS